VGQGVCGRAVAEKSTIIVDDVTKEDNYLACSLETKSEIVVPIWANGEIIGEIDIDSDDLAAFDDKDKIFLEEVAKIIGRKLEGKF
jgi:GAF domain-containing protein